MVAASAGNHAQGVALAARLLGITATVFMPIGAPLPKVAATKGYGAEVRLVGHTVDESLAAAHRFAGATGAVLVHPFDHVDVMAGQGTVGLEILEQVPDVRTVLVCTGGGGLLAGVAAAVKGLRPDVAVVGVQAHGAAAWPVSLAAGAPVTLPRCARSPTASPSAARVRSRSPRWPRWSTRSSRWARRRCPARCCTAWSARSSWWSPPERRGWRR